MFSMLETCTASQDTLFFNAKPLPPCDLRRRGPAPGYCAFRVINTFRLNRCNNFDFIASSKYKGDQRSSKQHDEAADDRRKNEVHIRPIEKDFADKARKYSLCL